MNDFLISEHSEIRKDISSYREEIRKIEQYALIMSAGVWAWVVANPHGAVVLLFLWVLVLIVATKAEEKQNCIDRLQEYLYNLEKHFEVHNYNLGLEGFLKDNPIELSESSFRHYWSFLVWGNWVLGFIMFSLTAEFYKNIT